MSESGQKCNIGLTELTSRCHRALSLSEGSRGERFLPFSTFQRPLTFLGSQLLLPSSKPAVLHLDDLSSIPRLSL